MAPLVGLEPTNISFFYFYFRHIKYGESFGGSLIRDFYIKHHFAFCIVLIDFLKIKFKVFFKDFFGTYKVISQTIFYLSLYHKM